MGLVESTASEGAECHDGILVVRQDTGGNQTCEYSSEPLRIEEELLDFGANEVRFSFTNNWGVALDSIDLFYDRGDGLGQQCQSLNGLGAGEMYPNTLAAACNEETQTADIEVYISAEGITFESSLRKCGDTGVNSCSYIYRLPCSTDVSCDDVRRLQSEEVKIIESKQAMNQRKPLTVSTKITHVKETKKIWYMSATTLVKLDTNHSVFQKWIQISCGSIRIITVDHVTDGMELTTMVTLILK